MFTPSSNSSTTMETLSCEVEVTDLMRSKVDMDWLHGAGDGGLHRLPGLAPGSW